MLPFFLRINLYTDTLSIPSLICVIHSTNTCALSAFPCLAPLISLIHSAYINSCPDILSYSSLIFLMMSSMHYHPSKFIPLIVDL